MKLYEYEAKNIFKQYGITIPPGIVIENNKEGGHFFELNKPVVLKSQVLTGGRGKAGGIRIVNKMDDYRKEVDNLLTLKIKNLPVKKILVEKEIVIKKELYLGYSILRSDAKIVFMISKEGGMEIEELAQKKPDSIIKHPIDILDGLPESSISNIVKQLGFHDYAGKRITEIALSLYKIFTDYECEVAEINPLVITQNNEVVAADGKISIYDEAVYKHPEYMKEEDNYTELEKRARKSDLGYVEMDGDIGVLGNGAGLNMATLDIITYFGGKPANFLEVSGRTYHKAKEAIEIIISNPNVKIIFGNFFGCISRCDVIAEGIAEAVESGIIKVPIVISMRGTGAKEGIKTLIDAGLKEIYEDDIAAGERVVKLRRANVDSGR